MDLTDIKDVLSILDDTLPFTMLCPVALTPEMDTLSPPHLNTQVEEGSKRNLFCHITTFTLCPENY